MARLFDEHIKRNIKSLNGAWKFKIDPARIGRDEKWYLGLEKFDTVSVPSVWNTEFGLLGYEGYAWYEKSFYFGGGNMRLYFGAVMTECEVWLDGEYIGKHYGGFSQFDFLLSAIDAGDHTLSLLVNNSFDKQSIPQIKVDWYHYGGIIREVEVEKLTGIATLCHRLEYNLDIQKRNVLAKAFIEL